MDGKRILAMTGFVFERKRADRALALLPLLPGDVVLCLLGGARGEASERHLAALRDQARRQGTEDRFIVTGYLAADDMAAGLAAAEMVLAPYQEVTSSASVADAIAAAAPVVASTAASFRDLAADGAGLHAVDAASPSDLLAAVRQILDDPAHAAELRARNRAYAERHSMTRFAAQIAEWYGEVSE